MNGTDLDGQTPLHLAARTGSPMAVGALLRAGAATGITDLWGETAADLAADLGDLAVAAALMGTGAPTG